MVLTFSLAARGLQSSVPGLLWCFFLTNIELVNSIPRQGDPLLTLAFLVDFASQLSAEKDTDKF